MFYIQSEASVFARLVDVAEFETELGVEAIPGVNVNPISVLCFLCGLG